MIKRIEIKNFKRINETPLILESLAPINYLVGENGSGKSSVLELLASLIHLKYNGQFVNYTSNYLNHTLNLNNHNGKLVDDEYNSFFKKGFSMKFKNQNNESFAICRNPKGGYSIDDECSDIKLGYEALNSKIIYSNPFFGDNFFEGKLLFLYNPLVVDYNKLFREDNIDDIMRLYNEIVGDELNLKLSIKKDGDAFTVLENGKAIQFEKIASGARTLFYLIGLLKDRLNIFNGHSTRIIIEEPEISFHPKLIKKLPEVIEKIIKTLNLPKDLYQFFISTHSPYIVSSALSLKGGHHKVYHIENGECLDSQGLSNADVNSFNGIMDSLGSKPSDMLFANGIIWVEGPSDAIYIDNFLKWYAYEEGLTAYENGLNYSFAYHGNVNAKWSVIGKDNSPESLIKLFNINSRFYFVFDSDVYKKDDIRIQYKTKRKIDERNVTIKKTNIKNNTNHPLVNKGDIKETYKLVEIDRLNADNNLYEMQHTTGYHTTKRIITKFLQGIETSILNPIKEEIESLKCFVNTDNLDLWYDKNVSTIEDYLQNINNLPQKINSGEQADNKITYAYKVEKFLTETKYNSKMPDNLREQVKKLYKTIGEWNK